MNPRSAVNIGAIIAAVTGVINLLGQVLPLWQQISTTLGPLIQQILTIFQQNPKSSASIGFAAALGGYSLYQRWAQPPSTAADSGATTIDVSRIISFLVQQGTPESAAALDAMLPALKQLGTVAAAIAKDAEKEQPKTPEQLTQEVNDLKAALVAVVNEARKTAVVETPQ